MEYPIVLEKEEDGRYSVYAPDLPGCASWGETREAIELWIESAKSDGDPVPPPGPSLEYIKIAG